jgi:hypothetical protein
MKMVRFNKPFIDGFTVLDLSKLHMYTVYYSQIKQRAPTAQVVLTDTDSFLLHVPDMPKSALMRTLKEGFDFSNYPADHPMHSAHLKSIPGYMKDESAGKHVVEVGKMLLMMMTNDDVNILLQVCALRAKCYVIRTQAMPRIASARASRDQLWQKIWAWKFTEGHLQKSLQSVPPPLAWAREIIKFISSGVGR